MQACESRAFWWTPVLLSHRFRLLVVRWLYQRVLEPAWRMRLDFSISRSGQSTKGRFCIQSAPRSGNLFLWACNEQAKPSSPSGTRQVETRRDSHSGAPFGRPNHFLRANDSFQVTTNRNDEQIWFSIEELEFGTESLPRINANGQDQGPI